MSSRQFKVGTLRLRRPRPRSSGRIELTPGVDTTALVAPLNRTGAVPGRSPAHGRMTSQQTQSSSKIVTLSPSPIGWERAGVRVGFPGKCRAFTLIEMMIVIAIIATILTAALPSLYGFVHKEGFRKTVSDVVETCRSARAEAIMHDTISELVFHPRDGTCEASAGGSGHGVWAHTARFENCTIEMLDVNLREFKDQAAATVHFYPNGRCDEMTLVLRSDKGEWRKISIECTTGVPIVSSKIQ